MTRNLTRASVCLLVATIFFACAGNGADTTASSDSSVSDPLNTTYTIEEQTLKLINGRIESQAAPGAASMIYASVVGRPVYGDLDGDGDEDAVAVIVYDTGGSGTFFYLVAAINQKGAYRGTTGTLLGDRIALQDVEIHNQTVVVSYTDRRPEEPMNAPPSVDTSVQLEFADGKLTPVKPDAAQEQVAEGWVAIGHEVRSFLPCGIKTEHWLTGNSPALPEIIAAYQNALPEARPYTPLYMTLAGNFKEAPIDGFGADYSAAFLATRLVQVWPDGNCRRDFIVVQSPRPGAVITSPLKVRGRARGTWFFEGDFPLILKDRRGRVIARGYATARGQWMTKNFVPFEGTITFDKPATGDQGILVFKKDNPTDRPKLDDEMGLPVLFK